MASGQDKDKSAAFFLLVLNFILYFIVLGIASWAVNHGMERSHQTATGYFVILALIAGVVGFTTSITGIYNVIQWNAPNLQAAAASSLVTWLLTLLAMGLACKEIHLGWIETNFRTLEITLIFLSGTQCLCTAAIHIGVADVAGRRRGYI